MTEYAADRAAPRSHTSPRTRAAMAAVPLLLVNGISVAAQYSYWRSHLPHWPAFAAAGFAAALESIAVFLSFQAMAAELRDDSAFRLRASSYLFGGVVGLLNASHYLAHGRITAASVGVGMLSASSPWLWAIAARRESRDELKARGMIEGHALRVGFVRTMYYPVRSFRVRRAAAWTGCVDIKEAIAMVEPQTGAALAALEYEPERLSDQKTLADAIRYGMTEIARSKNVDIAALSAREVADWLNARTDELAEPWSIATSYISDIQRRDRAARAKASDGKVTQLSRGRHSA